MAFHVEVDFSRFPIVAGFGQQGRDQPQARGFIGEDAGDAGAPFEFLIHPFQPIGGAKAFLVGEGQRKDGQTLGQIFLHPSGKFRGTFGVMRHDFLEANFGSGAAGAVKNAADGVGDFLPLLEPGHIGLGVLLEVELAALPRNGAK